MTERNSAEPVGFGPYVRDLRERAGLKQKQVAERIGVSQSHYSAIEAKSHRGYIPAPEIVSALARVYRVTEMQLLQAAGYLTDSPAARRLDDHGDEWLAVERERYQQLAHDEIQRAFERVQRRAAEDSDAGDPPSQREARFGSS